MRGPGKERRKRARTGGRAEGNVRGTGEKSGNVCEEREETGRSTCGKEVETGEHVRRKRETGAGTCGKKEHVREHVREIGSTCAKRVGKEETGAAEAKHVRRDGRKDEIGKGDVRG